MPRTSCLVSCCLAAASCHAALGDWPTGLAPDIVATLYVDDDAPPGGDGFVDMDDLNLVLGAWASECE
ncbi:MAG: hypothetical protein H6812_00950 [Phycisphaeraceae bacterium]|nr:hypothetical protein [Phycisphaerales bacterium]MCB9841803.1 hypothetical protein [Phycisphaeraceae bacterium]